jgi:hypothetical protein
VEVVGAVDTEQALLIHAHDTGGDFQDGVGTRHESSSLHVDDNRQETAKAVADLVRH